MNTTIKKVTGIIMLIMLLAITGLTAVERQITFPDKQLEGTIREALQLSDTDPITVEALLLLTTLNAANTGIQDLTGLGACKNLTYLDVSNNALLNSLTPIIPCTKLETLYFKGCAIKNITPLGSLAALQEVNMEKNNMRLIDDTEEGIINVKTFLELEKRPINLGEYWNGNSAIRYYFGTDFGNYIRELIGKPEGLIIVSDYLPITRISNKEVPWKISSFHTFEYMKNLEVIDIHDAAVSNLNDLAGLTKLREITLTDSSIYRLDGNFISQSTSLEKLNLAHNAIAEISGTLNPPALTSLNLSFSLINRLDNITCIGSLEELYINDTEIRSFDMLTHANNLKVLTLDNLSLRDLSPLTGLTGLTTLSIAHSTDSLTLQSLNALTNLISLDVSDTGLFDLTGIENFPGLKELNAADNRLTSVEPLKALQDLAKITLTRNRISDPVPLGHLTGLLKTLDITENSMNLSSTDPNGAANLAVVTNLSNQGTNVTYVYGNECDPVNTIITNIAQGKKGAVSSTYSSQYSGENLMDGNPDTIWGSSVSKPADWFYVDLGSETMLSHVTLDWYDPYYATHYQVYTSSDAAHWVLRNEQKEGSGGTETIELTQTTRYVGVYVLKKNSIAVGLKEFGVYRIEQSGLAVSAYVVDPNTNDIRPVAAELSVRVADNKILQRSLTSGQNQIQLPVDHHNYEVIVEKEGYYAYRKLYSQYELMAVTGSQLSIPLEARDDAFRPDSLHIANDGTFKESLRSVRSVGTPRLVCYEDRGYLSMTWYNKKGFTDIYDMTDPINPRFLSRIPLASEVFQVYETFLLIMDENKQISIYDIAEPESPVFIYTIKSLDNVQKFSMHENYLFVKNTMPYPDNQKLHIFRINEDKSLTALAAYACQNYTIGNDMLVLHNEHAITFFTIGPDGVNPLPKDYTIALYDDAYLSNFVVDGNFLYLNYSVPTKLGTQRIIGSFLDGFEITESALVRRFDYMDSYIPRWDRDDARPIKPASYDLVPCKNYLFTTQNSAVTPIKMINSNDNHPYNKIILTRTFNNQSNNMVRKGNIIYCIGKKGTILTD